MSPDEALSAGDRIKLWAWATLSQTPEAKLVLKLDGRLTMAEALLAHRASGEGGSTSALRASAPEGQDTAHEMGYALTCAERERDEAREMHRRLLVAATQRINNLERALHKAWEALAVLKPPTFAASVEAGPSRGAPAPLTPEGIDAKRPRVMALVPYADAKLYAMTLREAGWPDLAGGFLRQIEAGETVASLADLDAIAAQAVKQAIPSSASPPPPPEGNSTKPEPRANVMFDNHTFQTGPLSEVRDWIAESYDEDLRGACMLTVRWDDRGPALMQDHARHDETKVDLRNRWLAAIDRLKAEIAATPPIRETPRQKAMGLKIDVRCLRMVDDADARAMDRICRGIDELAALAEGAQG